MIDYTNKIRLVKCMDDWALNQSKFLSLSLSLSFSVCISAHTVTNSHTRTHTLQPSTLILEKLSITSIVLLCRSLRAGEEPFVFNQSKHATLPHPLWEGVRSLPPTFLFNTPWGNPNNIPQTHWVDEYGQNKWKECILQKACCFKAIFIS